MIKTPAVAITIASATPLETVSPSRTTPATATWIGSVLDNAVMMTKDFSRMAASKRPVAIICVTAPMQTHSVNVGVKVGSVAPLTVRTSVQNSTPNGNP
jgi:primosomal replication protein N